MSFRICIWIIGLIILEIPFSEAKLGLLTRQVGKFLISVQEGTYNPTIVATVYDGLNVREVWRTVDGYPLMRVTNVTLARQPIKDGNYQVQESYVMLSTDIEIDYNNISPVDPHNLLLNGNLLRSSDDQTYGIVGTFSIQFSVDDDTSTKLHFNVETTVANVNSPGLFLTYYSDADENFYGFGESFTFFNLKGQRVPILVSEQGVGRGEEPITDYLNNLEEGVGGHWFTTYAPKPIYLTNYNHSVVVENSETMFIDITDTSQITIEIWNNQIAGYIIYGTTMMDIVQGITSITGRQSPMPLWTQQGAVVGLEGGTVNVTKIVNDLSSAGVPLAGVWLQDWVGLRHSWDGDRLIWNWEVNYEYYPGWNQMVNGWALKNTRVLTYISPFFSDPTGFVSESSIRHNFYQEGIDNDYFVKNQEGDTYFMQSFSIRFAMVDLTNPDAVTWIKNIIKNQLIIEAQSSGWMCDFGEYLPFDAVLYSGESAASFHNKYPEIWGKVAHDAVQESSAYLQQQNQQNNHIVFDSSDIMYFMRSAWTYSPSYVPVFWLGDQLISWDGNDGIKSVVTGALSSGLTGHTITHSDIGGYTTEKDINNSTMYYVRSEELLKRWSELGAFGFGLFRTHIGSSTTKLNAQVYDSEESMKHFGEFASIYANMSTYRMELMNEAYLYGYPLIRPLAMHYGYDPAVWDIISQYLVGTEFLIAPCMDPGATTVEVYFPMSSGPWVHLWSDNIIYAKHGQGLSVTVPTPIGFPAVFYQISSKTGIQLKAFVNEKNYLGDYHWEYQSTDDDDNEEDDNKSWWERQSLLHKILFTVAFAIFIIIISGVMYRFVYGKHNQDKKNNNSYRVVGNVTSNNDNEEDESRRNRRSRNRNVHNNHMRNDTTTADGNSSSSLNPSAPIMTDISAYEIGNPVTVHATILNDELYANLLSDTESNRNNNSHHLNNNNSSNSRNHNSYNENPFS